MTEKEQDNVEKNEDTRKISEEELSIEIDHVSKNLVEEIEHCFVESNRKKAIEGILDNVIQHFFEDEDQIEAAIDICKAIILNIYRHAIEQGNYVGWPFQFPF